MHHLEVTAGKQLEVSTGKHIADLRGKKPTTTAGVQSIGTARTVSVDASKSPATSITEEIAHFVNVCPSGKLRQKIHQLIRMLRRLLVVHVADEHLTVSMSRD